MRRGVPRPTHGCRETRESGLEVALREKAEAQAEYPRLVAEPAAVRDPDSLPCEARVEAIDGAIVKDGPLQAHATHGPGVRPDPFDEGVILAYPICGERETFGQSPSPVADDLIAPLEDV